MTKYTTLFFDLDGTLWDLKKNTQIALRQLWDSWHLDARAPQQFNAFFKSYTHHNDAVWALYRDNKIEKELLRVIRFERAFGELAISLDSAEINRFADAFIDLCPRQANVLPGAHELLNALAPHYPMHIITNGFSEIQMIKMKAAQLDGFFQHIIYSEDLGIKKPHPEIFHLACHKAGCTPQQALMIGDDWDADVIGAMGVGMDQAFLASTEDVLNEIRADRGQKPLRHNRQPTYRLSALRELEDILLKNAPML